MEVTAPTWARPAILLPGFALAAIVGATFPSFSLRAAVTVWGLGAFVCWLGTGGRSSRIPAPDGLGSAAWWWAVPALLLAIVELVSFILGSTYPHPSLSVLADPLLHQYVARGLAYFAWLAGFWALVRR